MARLGSSTPKADKAKAPKKTKAAAKEGLSGVSFDKGGPVYEEELSAEGREINQKALESQLDKLDLMDSKWADKRHAFRAERKDLVQDIRIIRERLRTGKVKKAAQQSLPGTVEGEVEA